MEEKNVVRAITKLYNKRLKKIGKAIGIEWLSTYTARLSHAMVLLTLPIFPKVWNTTI